MTTAHLPPIDVHRSLGDLVAERPSRARVLERHDLDYCCHGDRSLADAATAAGLDVDGLAGELLAQLRTATNGYEVPSDGCASYEQLYQRLAALEADTHRHIHLENNVLVPAVVPSP